MKKSANLAPLFGATLLFATLTCNPLRAGAVSLSVDLDPATAGVQSTLTVAPGDSFNVAILINDVINLHGFEFDLDFGTVILATGVSSGGFLPVPAPLFLPPQLLEADIASPDVNFGEIVIGNGGASGNGSLASISFTASSVGIASLILNDVVLSAPFGSPIIGASLNNATVTVSTPTGSVSEPESIALFSVGLLGAWAGRRSSSFKAATRSRSTQKALG